MEGGEDQAEKQDSLGGRGEALHALGGSTGQGHLRRGVPNAKCQASVAWVLCAAQETASSRSRRTAALCLGKGEGVEQTALLHLSPLFHLTQRETVLASGREGGASLRSSLSSGCVALENKIDRERLSVL